MKPLNYLVILSCISIFALISGCESAPDYRTTTMQELQYDAYIAMASIDGFRIQMTARVALQNAKEKGYVLDTRFSNFSLEDIIEGVEQDALIFLERVDQDTGIQHSVELNFDRGKISWASLDLIFYPFLDDGNEKALKAFDNYLRKYPKLQLEKADANITVFTYAPNKRAYLSLILGKSENITRVTLSVSDRNYVARHILNY